MFRHFHLATIVCASALVMIGVLSLDFKKEDRRPATAGVIGWHEEVTQEVERRRKLDQAMDLLMRIRHQRAIILRELEEGKIDLGHALERMRPLNDEDNVAWKFLHRLNPERSDEEILGYQLVVAANSQPVSHPDRKAAFVRRLIAQLKERFGDDIMLPPHLQHPRN